MMGDCEDREAKRIWFALDELASLNKLPQLHTAVTRNRKWGDPVVLGLQDRSQMERPPNRALPSGSQRQSARSRSSG